MGIDDLRLALGMFPLQVEMGVFEMMPVRVQHGTSE